MRKIKFNKKTKNIILIVLSCVMLFGAIFGLVALFRQDKTTKEINPVFAIGGLTEDGKYKETEESIYTKESFECQGLKIELNFESNVSYRVFFYNSNNDFVESTTSLSTNYNEELPLMATTCRIVITPTSDKEIKWYEKSQYANQLTINIDKKQQGLLGKFDNMENAIVVLGCGEMKIGEDSKLFFRANEELPFYHSSYVDVSEVSQIVVKLKTETLGKNVLFADTVFTLPVFYSEVSAIDNISYELIGTTSEYSFLLVNVESYESISVCADAYGINFVSVYVL